MPAFASPDDARARLAATGYLADDHVAVTAYLADRLQKPLLCEGPAGVGKTELAKAIAAATGQELIRLQCYEGLDEAKALYEWNYKKQLLRIQADAGEHDWRTVEHDIFTEDFLLSRPLLRAIRSPRPVVLLVDEVDRVEVETEALLLEVLSDWQISVRELSEALKRRCLFLHMDYPDLERETRIIRTRIPEIEADLADQIARVVRTIRSLDLKKPPSISETLDWARTLLVLGVARVDDAVTRRTLSLLLKYQQDLEKAGAALAGEG